MDESSQDSSQIPTPGKRPYARPRLIDYGSVASLTQEPSQF